MDIQYHFEHRDEHYKHQEHISKLLGPQTNHKALFSAFSAIKKNCVIFGNLRLKLQCLTTGAPVRESRSAAQLAAGASDRGRGAECEAARARDPPLPRPQPMGAETSPEHGAAGLHNNVK